MGAGTVLTGFRGWAAPEQEAALPPGLYAPSLNHLAHALKAANARPLQAYRTQFFTADEAALMRRVIAVLLGDIQNPAEVIAGIVNWIDLTLAESAGVRAAARSLSPAERALAVAYSGADVVRARETEDPARTAREGLRALAAVPGVENDAVLVEAFRSAAEHTTPTGPVDVFYLWARQNALDGYYTSREGLKDLDYKGNAFYAESPGCSHPPKTG